MVQLRRALQCKGPSLVDVHTAHDSLNHNFKLPKQPRNLPRNINGGRIERRIKLDLPINLCKTRKIKGRTNHIACPKVLLTLSLPEHDTELNSPDRE